MAIQDSVPQHIPGPLTHQAGMVLVVDDDPDVGKVMHRALSRSGLTSLLALGPDEAIALAARHRIALLVTDFTMPGMTGVELASRIREHHPLVPVILVSGSSDAGGLVIEPPSAFLAKPLAMGDLASLAASFTAPPPVTS